MNCRCALLGLSLAVALASAGTAHADGCFVWDKERDIAGPTQKAILFYADGRQDLLLQVRYEGPVERFGWLIPVPGLPKVRQGSMECFYELSKLTQQRFPDPHGHRGGAPSGVRVLGLEVLQRLGGARAVELAMPLLRDPDPVVRKRARFFFEVVAGTDFAGDPARVEEWWAGRQTGPGSD